VINSILDALEPFGVKHIDMPALPMRVWKAIQEAKGEDAESWATDAGLLAEGMDETGGEQ
jgi:hypothetical protein